MSEVMRLAEEALRDYTQAVEEDSLVDICGGVLSPEQRREARENFNGVFGALVSCADTLKYIYETGGPNRNLDLKAISNMHNSMAFLRTAIDLEKPPASPTPLKDGG